MLAYAEAIFFIKFLLHLNVWELLGASNPLENFHDSNKIGFLDPGNSYTPSIFSYTVFDVLCILAILSHEYYLLRCGLSNCCEFEFETLNQAKIRHEGRGDSPFEVMGVFERRSLWSKFVGFLVRLSPKVKEEKPGKDLYTPTLLLQLLLLLYIIFFYTQMDGEYQNISGAFETNEFSGNMVVALLLQTGLLILDRYLYLSATAQSVKKSEETVPRRSNRLSWKSYFASKCIVYFVLVCFIHAMVFWYYPISGNMLKQTNKECSNMHNSNDCNNFQVNTALQWFYLIYLLYFLISAAQLRFGLPSFRAGSMPLTQYDNNASRYTFQVYMGVPFFFELRTMLDWSFTKSSLDLFQWFKFEEIYSQLYITKVVERGYYDRPRGEPIGVCEKFWMGICGLLATLLIILGPLIIFSSLNPIVNDNPVKGASVEIGLMINQSYYAMYTAERVQSIGRLSGVTWNTGKFYDERDIRPNERDTMQTIIMPNSSDTLWAIPFVTKSELQRGLTDSCNNTRTTAAIAMSYSFTRDVRCM